MMWKARAPLHSTTKPRSVRYVFSPPLNTMYDLASKLTGHRLLSQKASSVQSHSLESRHSDLVKSILKSLSTYANEHFPASSYGVYPTDNDEKLAVVLVANKYSPNNFWYAMSHL